MKGSKSHCKNGHRYDEQNTSYRPPRKPGETWSLVCKACGRDRIRRWREKNRFKE